MTNDVYAEKQASVVTLLTLLLLVGGLVVLVGFTQRPEFAFAPMTLPATAIEETASLVDPDVDPRGHAEQARMDQITQRFEQAVAMLHAKRYDFAVTALHRVLELSPKMPEAHVNMGFALLGLEKHKAAGDFFATAIQLRPFQGNAYWGLAVALEKLGDKEGALGAMRTYIHLASPGDRFVTKARAALWEWENELTKGPLPEKEAEWIERRGKEWEERNRPDVDIPNSTKSIDLLSEG